METAKEWTPQLAVIDHQLPDMPELQLVKELLAVNAMIDTAVVSSLSQEEFHHLSEGLGVLVKLPPLPGAKESLKLAKVLNR